ncbi:Endothelin-converting enzyme 2 [Stylophora pistillata]|uniref:Endothelin-converting enzyme 2 n=1 Tax=Stylophora pistillata TaxID=50429 RepID=A0A2B4RBH0_STYPI|nr:Endothelin-converting enzyme 2 [Stylophora pistillata]
MGRSDRQKNDEEGRNGGEGSGKGYGDSGGHSLAHSCIRLYYQQKPETYYFCPIGFYAFLLKSLKSNLDRITGKSTNKQAPLIDKLQLFMLLFMQIYSAAIITEIRHKHSSVRAIRSAKMEMIPSDPDDVVFRELPYRQKAKRIITALAALSVLLIIICAIFIVLFAMEKTKSQEKGELWTEKSVQKTCASKKCLFAAVVASKPISENMQEKLTEFDDEDGAFGIKYKLRHFTKFKILLVVTLILAVLSIIFITLFAVERSKVNDLASEKEKTPRPSVQTYCGTRVCFDAAKDMLKQLNQTVDPCYDFYEYACGGWESENALEPGETHVTGFSLVKEKSYEVLYEALVNAEKNYSTNEAVMKTVKFYNVCIDEDAVETRGDDPLKKLIDKMGGWNVTGSMTPLSSMNIIERIGKVSRELFIKPFVDVKVSVDPHDSNKHIVQFQMGKLGMLPSYYRTNTRDYQTIREAYKTYMKTIAKYLGGGADSDDQMMKVFDLETKIANLGQDGEDGSIIEKLKKDLPPGAIVGDYRLTMEQISETTEIDLREIVALLNAVFKRQNRKFQKDEKVIAYPPKYYAELFSLYQNVSKSLEYVELRVVRNYRHKRIVNLRHITQMTELIKEEFISGLDSLEWMSSLTKTNARIKLTVGEYLFENTKNALTFVADETYGSLDKPVDRDQWFMGPSQVNGYYSPRQNRIGKFPSLFILFKLLVPCRYLNYGGIGMVIGHEVTHGFDDNGALSIVHFTVVVDKMPKRPLVLKMTKRPLLDKIPKRPLVLKMTKRPLVDKMPKRPLVLKMTKRPLLDKIPKRPLVLKMTKRPLVDKMPKRPLVDKMPKRPLVHKMPERPLVHKMPKRPLVDKMPKRPPVHKVPKRPLVHKMPKRPLVDKIPKRPLVDKLPKWPLVDKMPKRPLVYKIPKRPLVDKLPKWPLVDKMPNRPLMDTMPKRPLVDKLPKRPLVDKLHKRPLVDKLPNRPLVDKLPNWPLVDKLPKRPLVDKLPNRPLVDKMPNRPLVDKLPNRPLVDKMPNRPLVDKMPKRHLVDKMPKRPLVDKMPKRPLVDKMPKRPLVDRLPKQPL